MVIVDVRMFPESPSLDQSRQSRSVKYKYLPFPKVLHLFFLITGRVAYETNDFILDRRGVVEALPAILSADGDSDEVAMGVLFPYPLCL
jgi:hypothetical protein